MTIFAAHSPHVTGNDPIAAKFNSVRKHYNTRLRIDRRRT